MQSITAPLAESISNALGGKRSGKGFRVPAFWRGSTDLNIYIADGGDGKLIAVDHSHGEPYQVIMQEFENRGLKPKDGFNSNQREVFIQKKTQQQLIESSVFAVRIVMQYLTDREADIAKTNDANYRKLHPEFVPMPDKPWELELEMAINVKKLLGELYGI